MGRLVKKSYLFFLILVLSSFLLTPLFTSKVKALSASDWQAGRIIDDSIFFNSSTMATGDIQAFLNSKVPTCTGSNPTCIKNYAIDVPTVPADAYCSTIGGGTNFSAAAVIKVVTEACGMNPQAMIVLIQKEQGLITSTAPTNYMYKFATGYCVYDTVPPPSCAGTDGFFNQIYYAARQFQKYAKNPDDWNFAIGRTSNVQYNPRSSCGSSPILMQTKATAGLYNYTPYQPTQASLDAGWDAAPGNPNNPNDPAYCGAYGNRNFWLYFSTWFGSTINGKCLNGYDAGGVLTGITFRKVRKNFDSGNYTIFTGSQSGCVETHVWNYNFTDWESHNASNLAWINPADSTVKFADLDGDGKDEPILVWFKNTSSGMVEFHVWNYDMKTWIIRAASNLPSSALTGVSIDFADLNGDGKDEPLAFGYTGTSTGKVEVHIWGDSITTWRNHTITNLPVIDPMKMQIGFANFDGSGPDEMVAFGISDTASGKIEFHLWNPGFFSWRSHHISNHSVINANNSSIHFADIDGNSVDSAILIHTRGTSSGRIEMHVWKSSLFEWEFNSASNVVAAP